MLTILYFDKTIFDTKIMMDFLKIFGFCPETIDKMETAEDLIESINSILAKMSSTKNDDIKTLLEIKDNLSSIMEMIECNKDNEYFNSLLRISEIICGSNLEDDLNSIYDEVSLMIEEHEKKNTKKTVNDCTCKYENNDFVVTPQIIEDALCQKILVNKQSNESQTKQLCAIIADFLNTGSPKLKDTKEDRAKINAAANLLFGFADFTLYR